MAEKLTFAHSPIHTLPPLEKLLAPKSRAMVLGRIAATAEKAARKRASKKK